MVTIPMELRARVRRIIADVLEVDPDGIAEDSDFVEEFDADSLLIIEMSARLERSLGVRVPPEEAGSLTSLGSAYELVAKYGTAEASRV